MCRLRLNTINTFNDFSASGPTLVENVEASDIFRRRSRKLSKKKQNDFIIGDCILIKVVAYYIHLASFYSYSTISSSSFKDLRMSALRLELPFALQQLLILAQLSKYSEIRCGICHCIWVSSCNETVKYCIEYCVRILRNIGKLIRYTAYTLFKNKRSAKHGMHVKRTFCPRTEHVKLCMYNI